MAAHPKPSEFEARTNATFEALMWALSRPGQVRTLPAPGPIGVVEALIDLECQVYCTDPAASQVAARAGAALVAPEEADHLFLGRLDGTTILERVSCGTDLHPEDGATLVLEVSLGSGSTLRLTGPGVDGTQDLTVDGLPDDFWGTRSRAMRYPKGFELILVDGDRVVGIPRSTSVESI